MPNLGAVLKGEITRLAKKVTKAELQSIQRSSAAHRKHIAELKRTLAGIEKEVSQLRRGKAAPKVIVDEGDADSQGLRFQARGLRTLRSRLNVSAEEFGRLAGVSAQTIYNWEAGKTVPRRAQLPGLARIRGMGKREARKLLSEPAA